MLEQDLYRSVSEFLAQWATNRSAAFELFHVVGQLDGRSTNELRELLIRFNVPFHFDSAAAPATTWTNAMSSSSGRGRRA
jgi:hypothetical protein